MFLLLTFSASLLMAFFFVQLECAASDNQVGPFLVELIYLYPRAVESLN